MKRRKPNQKQAHRKFTATALKTKPRNVVPANIRGGYRIQEIIMCKVDSDLAEKFCRDAKKRHKRYASERSVYAYRVKGSDVITDNLLLLPREYEPAHHDYLRFKFGQLGSEQLAMYKDFYLIRIGHFNVHTLKFLTCPHKVVLYIKDVIDDLGKVEKK